MITLVALKDANELTTKRGRSASERVDVTYDSDGNVQALSWLYNTSDQGLYGMVKKRGGVWDRLSRGWTFPDCQSAKKMLDAIVKKHPDWPVNSACDQLQPLAGITISRVQLSDGVEACMTPSPLPHGTHIVEKTRAFRLIKGKSELGLMIGDEGEIANVIASLVEQGAICKDDLAKKWSVIRATNSKLQVKVIGWAVQITCDLSNPLHCLMAPKQTYRWEGDYPHGIQVAVPWNGVINTTRKRWPEVKIGILASGLNYEGDDPDRELAVPAEFDVSRVAGWDTPAPNGYLLHAYQKTGALFCAERGMRALIGDEMGVGKTAQAIAAVEGCAATRVVVFCPASARYVWDREIRGWSGRGSIQHVTSQLDNLDMSARWHIVTYDQIATRSETWTFQDDEQQIFAALFPDLAKNIQRKGAKSSIKLEKSLEKVPLFEARRLVVWKRIMKRLSAPLLEQILAAGPLQTILDEGHRVKNKDAKRTKAIKRIAENVETQMLILTGTPLRNNEHEAAVLLSLLNDEAAVALCNKKNGYAIEDVKDYLSYLMIRRTKAEVLPELPEKTRQRIDIDKLDDEQMQAYAHSMISAQQSYCDALTQGKSEAEARQALKGGVEKARTALGVAKVLGGEVQEIVMDVVENKGCCVVFCAHHTASDALKTQLAGEGLRVAVLDGRTNQKDRAETVNQFQEGKLDVFIGGINAAGEAITLTRADTVIFVELDWVPAALLQAEDRIHRVGQTSNCHIIQLVARLPESDNLDEMMVDIIGSKMARIAKVLDEDSATIIAGGIQAQLYERLLGGNGAALVSSLAISNSSHQDDHQEDIQKVLLPSESADPSMTDKPERPERPEKRGRGRPKIYRDTNAPTATERSKQSIKTLANAGGKRVMLRLTPEAYDALKVIMSVISSVQETAAINQSIVAWKNELLRKS